MKEWRKKPTAALRARVRELQQRSTSVRLLHLLQVSNGGPCPQVGGRDDLYLVGPVGPQAIREGMQRRSGLQTEGWTELRTLLHS